MHMHVLIRVSDDVYMSICVCYFKKFIKDTIRTNKVLNQAFTYMYEW
jgi:hypothetical protein